MNVADEVDCGVQIAPLNFSKENNGITLGFISCIEDVMGSVDAWVSETKFLNVGLRSGTEYLHNLLFVGTQVNDPSRRSLGWGVGGHKNISDTSYLEIDANIQHINEDEFWTAKQNSLSKIRVAGGWNINDGISIFADPTFNYFVSDVSDGSDYAS